MRTSKSTSRRLKGQSAFEFLFVFGVFIAALLMGVWASAVKSGELDAYMKNLEIEDLMTTVTEKINTVWVEGEGFSSNLTLPYLVYSMPYEINVTSNLVMLTAGGGRYMMPIITQNVTGTLKKSEVNTLTNRGDHIEIS
jgi:hypothetical protein